MTIASLVSAQEDDPFDITLYGSFLHTATVPNALFFFNDIEQYDSFELRRALRNHEIDTVVLGSNGGSVLEGLNMAGIIYDRDITTYVPELPNEMGCYSACAYMFFGGKIRQADGVLAVHQSGYYGSDADKSKRQVSEVQQDTQFTVSEIIGFLNEFETPPWVYEKMFRSRDFYVFDASEKKRLAFRTNEIDAKTLDAINGFINSFFEYLENLDEKTQKPEETETPELSEEEELRLVVTEIQKLLNAAGCNAGKADGIWGKKTDAAAVLFAKTANLQFNSVDLISEEFIKRLKTAPKNFCPKQRKKLTTPKLIQPSAPNGTLFAAIYDVKCISRISTGDKYLKGVIEWWWDSYDFRLGKFDIAFEGEPVTELYWLYRDNQRIKVGYEAESANGVVTNKIGKRIHSFEWVPGSNAYCKRYSATARP